MALTASELVRLKAALGYPVTTIGAEPYISYVQVFDQVILPYTQGGASTTSSTTVAAATTPTVVTLTLTSAVGFTAGDRAVVDVDSFQETPIIRSVSGSTIGVVLSLAHTGTYPVTVEGGESLLRALLKQLGAVEAQFSQVVQTAGLKRAEDIEWYQAGAGMGKAGGSAQLAALFAQRDDLREQLARALNVANLWLVRRASGGNVVLW